MEQLISNKELTKELQKPIIKRFKKRKIQPSFIDSIWGADVADMQLISKFSKGIRFLWNVLWYAWVIPLEDKRGITITNAFQKMLV